MFKLKRYGFTLSEVLTTLSIVSIVAVLTLPNIISNHANNSYALKVQDIYTTLSSSISSMMTEERTLSLEDTYIIYDGTEGIEKFMDNYFNVVRSCEKSISPCFASSYKQAPTSKTLKQTSNIINSNSQNFILFSGASIGVDTHSGDTITFYVDVNGKNGPNILGKDFFTIVLQEDGEMFGPAGNKSDERLCLEDGNCLNYVMSKGWKITY